MLQQIKYKQQGFSLLEMIVVITILSISLSMLYKAAGGATRSVRVSEQYSYAVIMAQSLLDEHSTVVSDGVNVRGEGASYRWLVSSTPVIDESEQPATLHLIDVDVSWTSGSSTRVYTLSSVVPVRADSADTGFE